MSDAQDARKAQLENHEPEDEEDLNMVKDMLDSGNTSTFISRSCVFRTHLNYCHTCRHIVFTLFLVSLLLSL